MNIQTTIATKREILNDATQARVDATHREIRAAVDVIVTSVLSAMPAAAHIDFDVDEVTGEVGFAQLLDAAGRTLEVSEASATFWHETAGLIAPDEFMIAVAGVTPIGGLFNAWRLDLATYATEYTTDRADAHQHP